MNNVIRWITGHKLISLLVGLVLVAVIEGSIQSTPSPAQPAQPEADAVAQPTPVALTITPEEQAAQDAANKAAQAAFDNSPAGRICKANPTWQHDECTELANNQVWITNAAHLGMSYDMLVYLRGEADHTNVSDYGNGKQYQYCWDGYTPSCFYDTNGDGRMDAYN